MTETSKRGRFGRYIPPMLVLTDFVVLNILFFLVVHLCYSGGLNANMGLVWGLLNAAYIPVVIWEMRGKFNLRTILLDHTFLNALRSVGIHALFFLSLITLTGLHLGNMFYLWLYAFMAVGFPLWWLIDRQLIKMLRTRGRNSLKVVIVGSNQTADRLYTEMKRDPGFGYRVVGYFDDENTNPREVKYLGPLDKFREYVATHHVDEVYFTLSGSREKDLSSIVKVADDNFITFYYVPQISRYVNRNFSIHNIGSVPVLSQLRNPLGKPLNRFAKRTFDLVVSSLFLCISPVIFIPVAIGIKMSSPGPVFFKQLRTGYRGRSFYCWKFRTMRVNAAADSAQATQDDPRKTRFGDFLRRTSIDELPQFINVWLGDMSVVGPRPHMLKHTHDYSQIIGRYMVRHLVKPGITGYAQVNGYRGLTDEVWKMEKRVEYDTWYIEHWNIMLDLKIMVRTLMNAVHGEENAF